MLKEYLKIEYEILSLYKDLFLDYQDMFTIMELYQRYLKLKTKLGSNNPIFLEDKHDYHYGNCYTYALGLPCPNVFYNKYRKVENDIMAFNVGFLSKGFSNAPKTEEELLELFNADCKTLGIKAFTSNIEEPNSHEGYKICMYISKEKFTEDGYDFHFIRQNSGGLWSHKTKYGGPINTIVRPYRNNEKYRLVRTLEIVKPVIF